MASMSVDELLATVPECITSPESRQSFARLAIEIQAALRHLADLRTQQNALFPVARLSDDILFRVFSILAQPGPVDDRSQEDFRSVPRVSQVCSRWRAVASAPSLWSYVPTRNIKQAQEFLLRSGNAPVLLAIGSTPTSKSQEMRALLCSHVDRIRTLRIYDASAASGARWWIPWLAAPATKLESLTLFVMNSYTPMSHLNGWPCWNEPSDFGSHLSALHSLTLNGFYLPPGAPIFRHLRDLRLSRQPAFLLNSTTVGCIVSDIPQLETLYLARVGGDHTEHAIQNTRYSVALPRLRALTLHHVPLSLPGNLLDMLRIPPTARVDVRVHAYHRMVTVPIPRYTAGLAPPCVGARAFQCTVGHWERGGHGSVTFRTRRDPAAPEPDLVLTFNSPDVIERVCAVFTAEKALVEASGLERYTLQYTGSAEPWKTPGWKALLAEMSALCVLTVVDSPEAHLLELFDALVVRGQDGDEGRCTSLQAIHLRGVACTETFWRKLRAVTETRAPTLRTVGISEARGMTDISRDLVKEVEQLVEVFELAPAAMRG